LEDVQLTRFGPSVACAFILQQYCNGGDLLHYIMGDKMKETTKEQLKAQMRRRSKGGTAGQRPEGLFPAQRRLGFEEIYSLFKDITSGLAYLHAANYIHRDLKPENCLLHREGSHLTCLISDFGEVQPENMVRKSTGSTGTISYCAPEVLKKDATGRYANFTTKSDIFSLGMILYFMCFGRLPYQSANSAHEELEDIDLLRSEITHWKGFQTEKRERPDLPSKLYQLLQRLLAVNPQDRPSANEVLSAMKSDATFDGVPRVARSASPTFGLPNVGRRIQNLDSPSHSPMHHRTPSPTRSSDRHPERAFFSPRPGPSPMRHAKVTSSSDEDLAAAGNSNAYQQHNIAPPIPSAPRHRHTNSMVLSRTQSRNGYPPGLVISPSPEPSLPTSRDRSPDSAFGSPVITSPPLLMPPPTTRPAELRRRARLFLHAVTQNREQLTFMAKLLLFLLKMISLVQICWPYSVGRAVAGSLVVVAGADLGIPWVSDTPLVPQPDTRSGDGRTKVDHRTDGDRPRISPRNSGGRQIEFQAPVWQRGGAWRWDWKASLVLAFLHFALLAVMARSGTLCAVPGTHDWERW
jgi:serine/threonine protein kinase